MLVINVLFCPDLKQLSNVEYIVEFRISLRRLLHHVNGYLIQIFCRLNLWNDVELAHLFLFMNSSVGFSKSL